MTRFIFSSMLILVLSAGLFSHTQAHSLAVPSDCDIVLVDSQTPFLSGPAPEPFVLTAPLLELPYLVSNWEFDSRTVYQTEGWHPDMQVWAKSYQGDVYRGERAWLVKI